MACFKANLSFAYSWLSFIAEKLVKTCRYNFPSHGTLILHYYVILKLILLDKKIVNLSKYSDTLSQVHANRF